MSFRFEKLTTKAQEAIANSQTLAGGKGHAEITPLHLLTALLGESDGIVRPLLEKAGAPVNQLIEMVDSELDRLPSSTGGSTASPSRELQQVFEAAAKSAQTV